MATYGALKTTVLSLCDSPDSVEAGAVAETALAYAMQYLATKMDITSLIDSTSWTVAAGETSWSLATKLGASDWALYSTPNRVYVKQDSTATSPGRPYDPVDFMSWLDLKAIPYGQSRDTLFDPATIDGRPSGAYTIDPDSNILIDPITTGNVITLYWNKAPAAYASAGTPELPAQYHTVLVNGAIRILKEWIREPEIITDPFGVLQGLDEQIREIDIHIRGNRKRFTLRPSARYRV